MGIYFSVELYVNKEALNQILSAKLDQEELFDVLLDLCVRSIRTKDEMVKVICLEKAHKEYGQFYALTKDGELFFYRLSEPWDEDSGWELKFESAPGVLGSPKSIPKEFWEYYKKTLTEYETSWILGDIE